MKKFLIIPLLLSLALVFSACSDTNQGRSSEDTEDTAVVDLTDEDENVLEIVIEDSEFPEITKVKVGQKIRFVNEDGIQHTVTFKGLDDKSGAMNKNDEFDITFNEVGEFEYVCDVHPQMRGKIVVE